MRRRRSGRPLPPPDPRRRASQLGPLTRWGWPTSIAVTCRGPSVERAPARPQRPGGRDQRLLVAVLLLVALEDLVVHLDGLVQRLLGVRAVDGEGACLARPVGDEQ